MKKLLCGLLLLVSAWAHSTLAGAASVVLAQAGASGVSAVIFPDLEEIGRPANIWMGGVLNGTLYLRNGPSAWAAYQGGSLPIALTSAALPSSLQVSILNIDVSSLPGLDVYVGYGSTEADLSLSGHLAKVYTVPAQAAPKNGWWWNPNQAGRGFSIEIHGTTLFMAGYLYGDDGRATWLVSAGPMQDATTYQGRLSAFSNGQTLTGDYQAPAAPTDAGAVTLQFNDDSHGTLTWPGGTIPIERFHFSNAAAASFQPENGWWGNEAESGRWFFIEKQGDQMFVGGYMYDANGNPVWYVSIGAMASPTTYQGNWYQYANGQTLTGPYNPPSAPTIVGAVRLEFSAPDQATLTLSDDLQPTAALSPASQSVHLGPTRSKVITIKPVLKNRLRASLFGNFSQTMVVLMGANATTVTVTATISWLEDDDGELSALVRGKTYSILRSRVKAVIIGTIDQGDDICSVSGTHFQNLLDLDGRLTILDNRTYTGKIKFPLVVTGTACGETYAPPPFPFEMPLHGSMAGTTLEGDPPTYSVRDLHITDHWQFIMGN